MNVLVNSPFSPLIRKKSVQISAVFLLGALSGVTQYLPTSQEASASEPLPKAPLPESTSTPLNEHALTDTADIEQLLALKAPSSEASVQAWYAFALSLDDLDLGKRYQNRNQTTPLLSWYAYIAQHRPQAIYKLYNQGKLDLPKLEHLLQFGFLNHWEQNLNQVDKILLKSEQAVLSLALHQGESFARQRVASAFFKLGDSLSASYRNKLRLANLRFALPVMSEAQLEKVIPILESGVFRIDPRELISLKQTRLFKTGNAQTDDAETRRLLRRLIRYHASQGGYGSRMMSSYLVDGALLGEKAHLDALLSDAKTNASQPTNFYCAACGIALAAEGPIGAPLFNGALRDKLSIEVGETGFVIRTDADRKTEQGGQQ